MATITGQLGKVIWSAATELTHVTNWTCDVDIDIEDITSMGAAVAWRTKVTGLLDWTATVEAKQADGNTDGIVAPGDASAALKLYVDATTYLSGNAICTTTEISNPVDGVCTITYSFQGISTLSWT